MEDLLINKQVAGYTKLKGQSESRLDKRVVGLLAIMYPTFNIVKSEFDIYPDEPFIYMGDPKWIPRIKDRHKEPHIIIAPTGEYDLTDKSQLIDIAYAHHNKKRPNYIDEDLLKSWDDDTFYFNFKLLWVTGSISDRELIKNNLFLNIIEHFSKPQELISKYFEAVNFLGDESDKYIESNLLSFIDKSRNMDTVNSKNMKVFRLRQTFNVSYDKNVSSAITKLLDSDIDNTTLRNLNFILDLVWVYR